MKSTLRFTLPLLAVLIAAPASAAEPAAPTPSLSELGRAFKNALTEEETQLLIEYMRDSVLAAFKDEEVSLPPDLAFKLEVLSRRLKREGNFYLDNWLNQMEADIKRSLKEKQDGLEKSLQGTKDDIKRSIQETQDDLSRSFQDKKEGLVRAFQEKMEVPPPVPYTVPSLPFIQPSQPAAPVAPPPVAAPATLPPAQAYLPTPWGMMPLYFIPQPNYAPNAYSPPSPVDNSK